MTTRLEVVMTGNQTQRLLTFAGRIDDSALLVGLIEQVRAAEVVIDTGGVAFINSIGVREWMRFLRGLAATGARIRLENVAEVIVTQMNLIPDLRAGATVVSVQAPYACDKCGAELGMLVDIGQHAEALRALQPPTYFCPECGGVMRLADYPDRYFSFLKG
jgi:hypothetical protein